MVRQAIVVEDAVYGRNKTLKTHTFVLLVVLYVAELRRSVEGWIESEGIYVLYRYAEDVHLCFVLVEDVKPFEETLGERH